MFKRPLYLIAFCLFILAFSSFTYASNESCGDGYTYCDKLAGCSPGDSTPACGWANNSMGTQRKVVVVIDGETYFNNTIANKQIFNQNIVGFRTTGNIMAVSYDIIFKRQSAVTPANLMFRVGPLQGSGTGIAYNYLNYNNASGTSKWFRINNGTTDITPSGTWNSAKNRKYSVCMQFTNKTHAPNQKSSLSINGSNRLDNRGSLTQASYAAVDSIEFWIDANNGNGTLVGNIRMWSGNCSQEPVPTLAPSVTLQYPTNGSNYNIGYNKSIVIRTDKKADCSLNSTDWTLTRDNQTVFLFDKIAFPSDRDYLIKVGCNSSGANWRNVTINFTIDTVYPDINVGRYRGHNINMTKWNNSLLINFNISDKNLYAAQYNITRNDTGVLLYNYYYNASVSGKNSINISRKIFNSTSYITGKYYKLTFEASDSHTATEVKEFSTAPILLDTKSTTTSTITHDLQYGDFKISYPKDVTFTPIRETDKISYDITATKLGTSYQIIEADRLEYLKNSEYPCHFVVNFKGMKGYGYDCIGLKDPKVTELIPGKKYQIDYSIDTLKIKEQSLIGLNYIKKTDYLYFDNTTPTFVIPGRNTTTSTTGTLWFNTSEATNYTYHISMSCADAGANGSNIAQAIQHQFTVNNLRVNTAYKVNVTIYDGAGNRNTHCYNLTTKNTAIVMRQLYLNIGSDRIKAFANFSSTIYNRIHYQWKWFVNGSIYRQSLYTRPVNYTRHITNGSCYPYWLNLPGACPHYPSNYSENTTLAYDNNTATFAYLINNQDPAFNYDQLFINVSYVNNTYNETPKSINVTLLAYITRKPGASYGYPYGFFQALKQFPYVASGTCGAVGFYSSACGVGCAGYKTFAENTTVKLSFYVDNKDCLPRGKNNFMFMIRWARGVMKVHEVTTVMQGYEKNYTQNVLYNLQNISPMTSDLVGDWVFSAMAYQNTSGVNDTSGWYNTSILHIPQLKVNIFDEMTLKPMDLSGISTVRLDVFCDDKVVRYNLSNVHTLLNLTCVGDYMNLWFIYNSTTSYYRTLIPSYGISAPMNQTADFFMINLYNNPSVLWNLKVNDLTGGYSQSPVRVRKKTTSNGTIEIIKQYSNLENKAELYLIKDETYIISVLSEGGTERVIGDVLASTAESKILVMPPVSFVSDIANNIPYNIQCNEDANTMRITYQDNGSLTENVTLAIRNASSHAVLALWTTTSSSFVYSYAIRRNNSYQVLLNYTRTGYGLKEIKKSCGNFANGSIDWSWISDNPGIIAKAKEFVGTAVIIGTGVAFPAEFVIVGLFAMIIELVLFFVFAPSYLVFNWVSISLFCMIAGLEIYRLVVKKR